MARFLTRVAATAGAIAMTVGIGMAAAPTAAAKPAPPMPKGSYAGNVTTFPPGNIVWYGKVFTGNRVLNDTIIGRSFPGKVYPGRSVQNGDPVIVIDYRGTPVGFVRDELRSDGRGGYWGRSLNGNAEVLRFHLTKR